MANPARKLVRNVASIAGNPALLGEYVQWLVSSARTGGKPSRRLLGGIEIGNFTNFSEFHSVPRFIDETEHRFFESFTGEGAIIDIGANVGLVSLVLARRFGDREVHAFEPNPTTFAALEANIARNRAQNVFCHRFALSDAEGVVLFHNDPVKRGTASIATGAGAHVQEVPATTLDAFAASRGIDSIGLLKIDVEGFETLVLRGAQRVLNEIRPAAIYFEVCPALTERAGFAATEPARMLVEAGYELRRLTDQSALTPADVAGVELENWLAIPR
ncbi:hypothetical protein GCM10009087_15390 [Sphingomonas oligophenolica]|uniref:FkbM family methyltransferase n=1 Tax=Sphingomonas oligophenolica TaxID=301154 RepID=A0ABU9YBY4_9SPHN